MREIYRISDRAVRAITGPEPGKTVMRLNDGGGLFLRITKHKSKQGVERVSKSWEFFFTLNSKTSCTGLGPYAPNDKAPGLTLKAARDKAHELRKVVAEGRNPVAERKAARANADVRKVVTFADALDDYTKGGRVQGFKSERHRHNWRASIEIHALPKIGDMDVGAISRTDIEGVLEPLWATKTETARRVRMRLSKVFEWAIYKGWRETDDPSSLSMLKVWIDNQGAAEKSHHPALPLEDMPAWFGELRKRDGMAARALELLALCAVRQDNVINATWDQFHDLDGDSPTWRISSRDMKVKTDKDGKPLPEHRVPLPEAAVEMLRRLPREASPRKKDGRTLVFPAPRGGELSTAGIRKVLERMHNAELRAGRKGWIDPNVLTKPEDPNEAPQPKMAVPHGFRSTFKDYCAQRGFDNIQSEIALAHNVGDKVFQAYLRTDLVEQRRAMMNAWAGFCRGNEPAANVVQLREATA